MKSITLHRASVRLSTCTTNDATRSCNNAYYGHKNMPINDNSMCTMATKIQINETHCVLW